MGRVSTSTGTLRIDVHVGDGAVRSLPDDVLDGLTRPFKEIPPKHLYDSRGAELFDLICDLPEYYPTRTERAILDRYADLIVRRTGMAELVELGSGTAAKTRVLLSAMERAGTLWRYVPFDVAEQVVRDCAAALADEYPALNIHGIVGDFERHLGKIPRPERGRPRVVEAAYDDAQGVTAEFNRNVLHVLNRELDADFPTELFEHVAFFDPDREWIEMRLRARRACQVHIGALDLDVEFARGEELRTEISAKFTSDRLKADYAASGLELAEWFTDDDGLFALSLASRP
jgi:L-histidine N-alpha-methyltransferase